MSADDYAAERARLANKGNARLDRDNDSLGDLDRRLPDWDDDQSSWTGDERSERYTDRRADPRLRNGR